MKALFEARIQDLGSGDFVKVECAACGHAELLASDQLRVRGLGESGASLVKGGSERCGACLDALDQDGAEPRHTGPTASRAWRARQ